MPYMPELPYSYEAIVNYNHSVYNIHGIHTAPAGLESTCLVLCYGLGKKHILVQVNDHAQLGSILIEGNIRSFFIYSHHSH